jgi:hypothetical protein
LTCDNLPSFALLKPKASYKREVRNAAVCL